MPQPTQIPPTPPCVPGPQDELIVEYDTRSMAPIGMVCMDLPDDCTVVLRDADGGEVDGVNTGGRLTGSLHGACVGDAARLQRTSLPAQRAFLSSTAPSAPA